jgi:hypothetical protein
MPGTFGVQNDKVIAELERYAASRCLPSEEESHSMADSVRKTGPDATKRPEGRPSSV